jgi:hypothetical protein
MVEALKERCTMQDEQMMYNVVCVPRDKEGNKCV